MDPADCREIFARLLADEAGLLTRLSGQLQREHEMLVANDVDGLDEAGAARQDTIARLLGLEDERADLCRQLGASADRASLASLIGACDEAGLLARSLAECARLAGHCRAQNERNGLLVNARLNRVGGMLDMLSDNAGTATYRPRAGKYAAAPAGRMVSVSA